MSGKIREILMKTKEKGKRRRKRRRWWDMECRQKKSKVSSILREWRKKEEVGQEFRKEKREYKEFCERKKREENEKWGREAEEAWEMSVGVG